MIQATLSGLSAVTALASAWNWLQASRVVLSAPINDSYDGEGPFAEGMKKQARLNKQAATFAAVAALFLALQQIAPYIISN
ncbi:MAG: hypothetical protein WDN04_07350 [Rhodospirillales bacterium]